MRLRVRGRVGARACGQYRTKDLEKLLNIDQFFNFQKGPMDEMSMDEMSMDEMSTVNPLIR